MAALSSTTRSSLICPCSYANRSTLINSPPKSFNPLFSNIRFLPFNISNCVKSSSPRFSRMDLYPDERVQIPPISPSGHISWRLSKLVSEFRSLPEPIDRVKRLLDYAGVLPLLGGPTRSPEIRIPGCAAQVWLEVKMDELGMMRFAADSDSEITKGFCSCLIFLMDGAYPEDVLKVKAEDLTDMNVGLPVRSRVNSWHNVLVHMQERTRCLAAERETCQLDLLEAFPSLIVSADQMITEENEMPGMNRFSVM